MLKIKQKEKPHNRNKYGAIGTMGNSQVRKINDTKETRKKSCIP